MKLLSPVKLGAFTLKNRVVMAPMARARSDENRAPTDMVAQYYAQRAGAGLIVTEASSISIMSPSRPHASAIYAENHVAGFAKVAAAVHAAGGIVFQQIYHLGRKADPTRMPDGAAVLAPSAIAAKGTINGVTGPCPFGMPRAIPTGEIVGIVEEFRRGATNAKRAGMDGVEVHGASAYLIDQFLRSGTNLRTDRYGGSAENRARFMLEVVDAVVSVMGKDRVGIKLAPRALGDGIFDANPAETFGYAAEQLGRRGIAYITLVEGPGERHRPTDSVPALMGVLRKAFGGALIVNGGYGRETAEEVIAAGRADLVSFAIPFISNPDLVERFRLGAPLAPGDEATFHSGGAKGYIDYPTLAGARAAQSPPSHL
jgi:N-ethylmaleimide reductase